MNTPGPGGPQARQHVLCNRSTAVTPCKLKRIIREVKTSRGLIFPGVVSQLERAQGAV